MPETLDALTKREEQDGPGIGMPAALYLDEFGMVVHDLFGAHPYLVGSALHGKNWRDVDVRLILDDDTYAAWGLGEPRAPHQNAKWIALVMSFSALARQMTGLPVDFQIQQRTWANDVYKNNRRGALGVSAWIRRRHACTAE